jgi:polyisoprenoid-binding protein YceI
MKKDVTGFLILSILLIPVSGASQQIARLLPSKSSITIDGTSNLHDWTENVENFNVALSLNYQNERISAINHVDVSCQSTSITSDYSIMTNKTLNALKAEKYPEILFKMVSVETLSIKQDIFSGIVTGDLSLAGVTKRVRINFSGNKGGNSITIKGSEVINMTDYNIDPPTALWGTLKTGEIVIVSFNLQFQLVEETYLSHKSD